MNITLDPHAAFQIARRGIPLAWVEETLREPEATEQRGDGKISFLRCRPERGKMLRVVCQLDQPEYVITAYLDRRKPCV